MVEGLFTKIKEQYTERLANVVLQRGKQDENKVILGEYFIDGFDDEGNEQAASLNAGKDASRSATPREEQPSRSRDRKKQAKQL